MYVTETQSIRENKKLKSKHTSLYFFFSNENQKRKKKDGLNFQDKGYDFYVALYF